MVRIHGPAEFQEWLAQLAKSAAEGDEQAARKRRLVLGEMAVLRALAEPPAVEDETAELKWVRQSKRYRVWRVSHPYHPGVAVRLICWFPPDAQVVVVALFAGDKGRPSAMFGTAVSALAPMRSSSSGKGRSAMTGKDYTPSGPGFADMTAEVDAMLAEPEIAAFIEAQRPAREAMNRAFAMNLATVRKAAELTQKDIAAAMGRDQSSVSKLETRSDMLLSTLAEYLLAAGVDAATITVTVKGLDYSFDLAHVDAPEREIQDA